MTDGLHPNDRAYCLEQALRLAEAYASDRKVIEDLRQMLAWAQREARK